MTATLAVRDAKTALDIWMIAKERRMSKMGYNYKADPMEIENITFKQTSFLKPEMDNKMAMIDDRLIIMSRDDWDMFWEHLNKIEDRIIELEHALRVHRNSTEGI